VDFNEAADAQEREEHEANMSGFTDEFYAGVREGVLAALHLAQELESEEGVVTERLNFYLNMYGMNGEELFKELLMPRTDHARALNEEWDNMNGDVPPIM